MAHRVQVEGDTVILIGDITSARMNLGEAAVLANKLTEASRIAKANQVARWIANGLCRDCGEDDCEYKNKQCSSCGLTGCDCGCENARFV